MAAYSDPRWLQDLRRFLPLKSQFVLTGNVRDSRSPAPIAAIWPIAVRAGPIRLQPSPLAGAEPDLHQAAAGRGDPQLLAGPKGPPLFALYFAVTNPSPKAIGLAKRVHRDILSKLV